MSGVASAVGGAAVLGGGLAAAGSIGGALIGSSAQTSAANSANAVQQNMFNQTQANLAPYMQAGNSALNALMQGTGLSSNVMAPTNSSPVQFFGNAPPNGIPQGTYYESNAPVNGYYQVYDAKGNVIANNIAGPNASGSQQHPGNALQVNSGTAVNVSNALNSPLLQAPSMNLSESALEATPGYQFTKTQGLQAVQNSASAQGLGISGAALKGAADYATGLADNTYQNQFNNAVTNQTNQFNRLLTLAQGGQNAAANLGGIGTQTASNIGNNLTGAGNARAASYIAGANGLTGAIGNYNNYNLMNQYIQGMYGD